MSSFFLFSRGKHCQLHARALFGTACNLPLVLTQQTGLLECGSFTNYCYKKDLYWRRWSFIKRAIWKGIGRLPPTPSLKDTRLPSGCEDCKSILQRRKGAENLGQACLPKTRISGPALKEILCSLVLFCMQTSALTCMMHCEFRIKKSRFRIEKSP